MTTVLGYGGGTQTVGMCLLVGKGVLPKPDRIVMADTGREVRSTFRYLDRYARPYLAGLGLDVEVAAHHLATVDLYAKNGDLLLPAFTSATTWIGFSFDERERVKGDGRPPWLRSFPLVDLMLTRADLEAVIGAQGWPLPPKSRCWLCPHQTNAEWRELRDTAPDEFARAVEADEEIRETDDRGALYLHHSGKPLKEADLDIADRRAPARQCGLGTCWL